MSVWRVLRLIAVLVVLAAGAWLGTTQGLAATRAAATTGQRVATAAQLVYGFTGVVALVAVLARRRWASAVLALWALAVTTTAALAPVVWGQSGLSAALGGGVGGALVSALVWWGGRAHVATGLGPTTGEVVTTRPPR